VVAVLILWNQEKLASRHSFPPCPVFEGNLECVVDVGIHKDDLYTLYLKKSELKNVSSNNSY